MGSSETLEREQALKRPHHPTIPLPGRQLELMLARNNKDDYNGNPRSALAQHRKRKEEKGTTVPAGDRL